MIESIRQDVSYAVRSLRRRPGFTLLAASVLAAGIGTSTAIATVYSTVLLRRLPVRDQDRIVVMWGEHRARNFAHMPLKLEGFRAFRTQSRALSDAAAVDYNGAWPRLLRDRGNPVQLRGIPVSGDFFRVLGTRAFIGRTFSTQDDVPGAAGAIVISHAAWQNRFGRDPAVIGRTLQSVITGKSFTIVGVMPAGFEYPRGTEFWAPIVPTSLSAGDVDVIGRLADGATLENARDELSRFFREDGRSEIERGASGVARSLPELVLGDVRPVLRMLAAAVGLLLIVSCVNVANLLLIRGVERMREVAVRSALGAGRSRLVRQLLTESALLAAVAGALGALLAVMAIRGLVALAPAELPRVAELRVGSAVLWAAAITLAVTVLFGLAPALWVARRGTGAALVGATRWGTEARSARLTKDLLVGGQVALAVLVLTGAGLVTRTLLQLQRLDVGFAPDRLLVAELGWPADKYDNARRGIALYDALVPAVQHLPGVVSTSPLLTTPFSGTGGWDGLFVPEDQSAAAQAGNPWLNVEVGSPTYFTTMGIPLHRGRLFTDADREGAARVLVVSEGTARALWPGRDAVGKRLKLGPRGAEWWTVIGVVADTRYREFTTPRPTVYFPLRQIPFPYPPTMLVVRTRGDPAAIVPALRRTIAAIDPDVVLAKASPMARLLDKPLAQPRLNALLLTFFAAIVLVLAAAGLYGVLAWTVRQRTRELGIRIALGADPRRVRRLVLRRGMGITAAGVAAGLLGALVATRALRALLFEVSPADPLTFVGAGAVIALVAMGASLVPARRATRVDPVVALRAE
ncbi:MAG: ABC transporter permease [Gemmatimonadaceae bacterium]